MRVAILPVGGTLGMDEGIHMKADSWAGLGLQYSTLPLH